MVERLYDEDGVSEEPGIGGRLRHTPMNIYIYIYRIGICGKPPQTSPPDLFGYLDNGRHQGAMPHAIHFHVDDTSTPTGGFHPKKGPGDSPRFSEK